MTTYSNLRDLIDREQKTRPVAEGKKCSLQSFDHDKDAWTPRCGQPAVLELDALNDGHWEALCQACAEKAEVILSALPEDYDQIYCDCGVNTTHKFPVTICDTCRAKLDTDNK